MSEFLAWTVLLSHGLFLAPHVFSALKGKEFSTLGYIAIGFLAYYDIGIVAELAGVIDQTEWFDSYLDEGLSGTIAGLVLVAAPWVVGFGWRVCDLMPGFGRGPVVRQYVLTDGRVFIILAVVASSICAFVGIRFLLSNPSIWAARKEIGVALGTGIVILGLPRAFLAFWLALPQSKGRGWVITVFLALTAILSTIPIGQRTTVLLPILMVIIAKVRLRLSTIALVGAGMIFLAGYLLPYFKYQHVDGGQSVDLMIKTVALDFHRANVLRAVVQDDLQGIDSALQYPGAGYVYSMLALVPRSWAPVKGYGSSGAYTVWREGREGEPTWALALGAIEEAVLNFGTLALPLVLMLYGIVFRSLNQIALRFPPLALPVKLSAIWIWGYDSSVVVLLYGVMFIMIVPMVMFFSRGIHEAVGKVRLPARPLT